MPTQQRLRAYPKTAVAGLPTEPFARPKVSQSRWRPSVGAFGGAGRPSPSAVPQTKRSRRRDGIVLIAALMCLMVSSLAVASIFRIVRTQRRQTTQRAVELQASWLAEAGIQRAIAQLAVHPAYDGENWRIDVPFSRAVPGDRPASNTTGNVGQVQITVERNDTELQRLAVIAEYPFAAANQVRKSITWSISTQSTDGQTSSKTPGGMP